MGILSSTRYISSPGAILVYSFANSCEIGLMTTSKSNLAGSLTVAGSGVDVLMTWGASNRSEEAGTARAIASRSCFSASGRLGTSDMWDGSGDLDLEGSLRFRADFREGLLPFGSSDPTGRDDVFDLEEGFALDLVDRGVLDVGFTGS